MLIHWIGFTGEQALIDFQHGRLQNGAVHHELITGAQNDDIV